MEQNAIRKASEAEDAIKAGRYDLAERLLSELAESDPDEPFFLWRLGHVYLDQHRYVPAMVRFRKVLEGDPDSVPALDGMARALADTGEFEKAELFFRRRLAIKQSVPQWVFLGAVLLELDRFADAEAAFRKAIELDPNYEEAYLLLARALARSHQFSEAMAALEKAIQLDPQYWQALRDLGWLKFREGDMSSASANLAKSIAIAPNDPDSHLYRGCVLQELGRCAEADEEYQRAIALSPPGYDVPRAVYKDFLEHAV